MYILILAFDLSVRSPVPAEDEAPLLAHPVAALAYPLKPGPKRGGRGLLTEITAGWKCSTENRFSDFSKRKNSNNSN